MAKKKESIDYIIEEARPGDEEDLCMLVHELAKYEKAPEKCHATPELMRRHLFGDRPVGYGLVVRAEGKTVAGAIYFLTFPTWPCKPCVHLEDLFVLPEYRKRGIGGALLKKMAQICVERGYERLEWTCLEWNELAKSQYRKIGAEPLEEWRTWRLDGEKLDELGALPEKPRQPKPKKTLTGEQTVEIYTDGGAQPNPGVGGWAAVLIFNGNVKELSGGEVETTNNRMEMLAAINALEALKRPCKVIFHTDSQYVKNGITTWIYKWKKKNWRRGKSPVKNVDLWQRLDAARERHEIEWVWVRGHAGNYYNERCDELCAKRIRELRSK